VKSPKFPDVFSLAQPLLFKSGLAVIAPLSGRTVKSTVGESFSFFPNPTKKRWIRDKIEHKYSIAKENNFPLCIAMLVSSTLPGHKMEVRLLNNLIVFLQYSTMQDKILFFYITVNVTKNLEYICVKKNAPHGFELLIFCM
jgi:hypothetical protein